MKKDFSKILTENIFQEEQTNAHEAHEEKIKRGRGRQRIYTQVNDTAAALQRSTLRKGEQLEADPEEKRSRAAEGKTQGRKGCYMPHINMRFTSENEDYIRTMSAMSGQNMTQFVNECVRYHREQNAATYERIKNLREDMNQ